MNLNFRRARPDEWQALHALAMRSKAHWGYDADFLAMCKEDLKPTPARIEDSLTFVLEADGELAGYYLLTPNGEQSVLDALFLEPNQIGKGHGKRLFAHLLDEVRSLGITRFQFDADPYAEAFYAKMGAVRIGDTPSSAIPGRMLPLMEMRVPPRAQS